MRNFQRLKTMSDFSRIDSPHIICADNISQPSLYHAPSNKQMILRMLVRPKYGGFYIPSSLSWLKEQILQASIVDYKLSGIKDSWCYVTVRHGLCETKTDDEWHFDGASFRTELIPERNYVWVSHTGPQYKTGHIDWPEDFNPRVHNLFSFAEKALSDSEIQTAPEREWLLFTPFCLHRRNPASNGKQRTFIRIGFTDIEGRDINNTENRLLPTPFYGRDPVKSFRNKLINY